MGTVDPMQTDFFLTSDSLNAINSNMVTMKDGEVEDWHANGCKCGRNGIVVPFYGPDNADIIVMGEYPGISESAKHTPFIGKSGMLLRKMLSSIGIRVTTDCIMCNAVMCFREGSSNPSGIIPSKKMYEYCARMTTRAILLHKRKIILTFGRNAVRMMTGMDVPLYTVVGKIFKSTYADIGVYTQYNPASLSRLDPVVAKRRKEKTWENLKSLRKTLEQKGVQMSGMPSELLGDLSGVQALPVLESKA